MVQAEPMALSARHPLRNLRVGSSRELRLDWCSGWAYACPSTTIGLSTSVFSSCGQAQAPVPTAYATALKTGGTGGWDRRPVRGQSGASCGYHALFPPQVRLAGDGRATGRRLSINSHPN